MRLSENPESTYPVLSVAEDHALDKFDDLRLRGHTVEAAIKQIHRDNRRLTPQFLDWLAGAP